MKNLALSLFTIAAISLTSCNKSLEKDDLTNEISTEKAQIHLSESNFTITEQETLSSSSSDYYTSGILSYKKENNELAKVHFGNGENDHVATCFQNGEQSQIQLMEENCSYKGKKSKYKKVIVSPIVKTDDCDYLVSGIIKYYEVSSGNWVATIDFGDGTCDDIAVKTTADGDYTFTISEYFN